MSNTISVIIPTFNRKDYIVRALDSVLNQTLRADEIIVVDDGSEDNTSTVVRNYFPLVKYIVQKNSGVSSARNTGIRNSIGDWIAFLDSDDQWHVDKLRMQIEVLSQTPEIKICHTNETWVRNGIQISQMQKHRKYGGWIFKKCLPLCIISPSSVIIHRSLFNEIGNFDESLPACEDYDLWLRISAIYPVVYLENQLIIKYGGHSDQLSKKYWGIDRFRIIALKNIILSNTLTYEYKVEAIDMIIRKIMIYQKGARKRNKIEEVNYYNDLLVDMQSRRLNMGDL